MVTYVSGSVLYRRSGLPGYLGLRLDWVLVLTFFAFDQLHQQPSIVEFQAVKEAGRSSRPAYSWTLPQFSILLQLPKDNSNQG